MVRYAKAYRRAVRPRAGVSGLFATAGKMAMRYAASRTRSSIRPRSQNTEPLTGQFDYKTDYRKRRLGKRARYQVKRRRKWNRKVVNVVRNANVGTTHIIRRALCQLESPTNTSNSVSFGLYGLNGATGDTFNPTADIA